MNSSSSPVGEARETVSKEEAEALASIREGDAQHALDTTLLAATDAERLSGESGRLSANIKYF
jgi:hypothetical protein